MLTVLKIKNLALVDDLTWEIGSGLVGVTGQTGAGKSMIVGALKLVLGERANHDLIRTGEASCTVEAIFELSSNLESINEMLEEGGLEPCEGNTLVVKRVFGGSSGNKQFVNCSPCTLAILKSLGNFLVDLHGPHEHQSLLSQDRQLAMLDAYAKAQKEREKNASAWREWQSAVSEMEEFRGLRQATDAEIDLLRYQVQEIEEAGLNPNDGEDLEQRYRLVSNGGKLVELANEALGEISGSVANLGNAGRALRDLEKLDPKLADLIGGFESARVEIEEIEDGLRNYSNELEFDPSEIGEMERRIDLIENLKRKYGQSIDEVIEYGAKARERLEKLDSHEEELTRLEEMIASARAALDKAGNSLKKKREKFGPELAAEIAGHLEDLGFKQSVFEVQLESSGDPLPKGFETVDFIFAPNPGEPPKPLRVIASSGEMSRVMLAAKSSLADQDQIPLMVFDEIDANVGGEIAHAVGRKMAALGERHQVVAITHMPQVAALAQCHYVVTKEFSEDSTHSSLQKVDGEGRVAELSRMLGGIGDETSALAESLLSGAAV